MHGSQAVLLYTNPALPKQHHPICQTCCRSHCAGRLPAHLESRFVNSQVTEASSSLRSQALTVLSQAQCDLLGNSGITSQVAVAMWKAVEKQQQ